MAKRVLTGADIEALPAGGEVVVPPDTIVTDRARQIAPERGGVLRLSGRATERSSREHNNANVLTLGGRLHREDEAREIMRVWLDTEFAGGRHQGRVDKITTIENFGPTK